MKSRIFVFLPVNILLIMAFNTPLQSTPKCVTVNWGHSYFSPQNINLPAVMFINEVPAGSCWWSTRQCDGHHIKSSQVGYQSGLEGGGGNSTSIGISRFLKPQSEEDVLQLSRHQEWQKPWSQQSRKTFVPLTTLRPRVALVGSDYGFKNPAQVHLEYKDIFS